MTTAKVSVYLSHPDKSYEELETLLYRLVEQGLTDQLLPNGTKVEIWIEEPEEETGAVR